MTFPARPNVLCVVADDFGVAQLGCSNLNLGGTPFFATPRLDRLAAEGVRFARAYSTAPVCSPARASLYTGLHPARLHVTDFIPGSETANTPLRVPSWRRGLPTEVTTIGDALKAEGYATAHFGKWHLAPDYNYTPGRAMDPESQGFDEVVVTRKPLPDADPETNPHHIEALTDRAIEFCTRRRAEPFLCVVAHNALHRPELAPGRLLDRYACHPAADAEVNRSALGAMVEQIDAAIGRLLDALRAAGRDDNTIVIFTADHGPLAPSDRRKPLRGAKADLYEGGLRVPLLMRWPQHVIRGVVCERVVSTMDLMPTLLAATGTAISGGLDGVQLWPLLREPGRQKPRDLHWHYPHYHHLGRGPCGAIRVGDYKLIEWFEATRSPSRSTDGRGCELFNVNLDPGESRDLALVEPERRDSMLRQLQDWRRSVDAQEMEPNPDYDSRYPTRIGPPPSDSVRTEES